MYVGAASQHALRMSFVPEQEAQNFDRQVLTFWSRLMHRDITSQFFFLPLKLGGFGVGSAVQRHAAAPWRAWQSVIPSLMTITHSPDTDSLFHSTPILRAQLTQLQSTISQQMNKPTFLHKPLWAALRLQTTQKKQVSTIQRNIHKQLYNSLTDTPTERAILLSQSTSHTGAHLMQPRSEAYEIEDRCFRVSVARRLMLPHPVAANPADVVQFCPNKSVARVFCNKPLDPKLHNATDAGMKVVLTADMQHWPDVLQISFSHTVGSKFLLNKKYLPSLVLLMDKLNELGWTLSLISMVQSHIWTSLSLLPSLAIRLWLLLPVQNQVLRQRERKRPSLTGIHTSILSRSFLRQLADPVHMPRSSLIICCEMLTTHQLLSETPGPPSRVFSTVPSPNNNLWLPLRDSWGLLSHPVASYILFYACECRPPGFAHNLFSVSSTLQWCYVALLRLHLF